ncbi:MAG: replicative DNA helicase [Hallerella porci]|uniref:Replicative DNA helicase n=1 Tax=Hallerella porci TaxID=1945871 RepID=A0ABX5LMT2_9BACT|nr:MULTISPECIES: replicative DNA helicase [Hallerella]MCI5599800.1 replicative DNA helicase [Hallerella sp.]MDY3922120.1 replicative DNA helicase [Hallerella porci]PWL03466.1 primary replicative DNA helicase [Hallerella porci]
MAKNSENYEYSGRSAPQAAEAEVNLLGGVMQDSNVLSDVISLLNPDDFYQERHKIIWEVLQKLSQMNTPIDEVTLQNALEKEGKLEAVGGVEYLLKLIESVASGANARYHAEIIQKKAVLRRLINVSNEAIREAEDPTAEPDEIISKVEGSVMSLAEKQVKNSLRPAGDVVQEVLKAVENRRDGLSGCPTGFTDLDRLTNGLQPSDLIILAGRPGMGKSAFALTLASNSSINYGKKVAFFSLEMGAEQLMQRIICSMAGLELSKFRAGHLNRDEFAKLPGTASRIVQANSLYVDDNLDLGIMELLSKCRSLKRKVGLDLVIVDYLQLMKTGKEENRAVAVGAISRGLKVLAKDLKIPVIALAQLSRKTEDRADAVRGGKTRPQLSDLRESGSIEQDADMVWFIERPFYRSHDEADKNKAQLLVAKHRNGATADIDLTWIPQYTKFENYIPEEEAGNGGGSDFGSLDDIGV